MGYILVLAYDACQWLVQDQSDWVIIARESHMRMGEGEDNWQWTQALDVANAQHAELRTALHAAIHHNGM